MNKIALLWNRESKYKHVPHELFKYYFVIYGESEEAREFFEKLVKERNDCSIGKKNDKEWSCIFSGEMDSRYCIHDNVFYSYLFEAAKNKITKPLKVKCFTCDFITKDGICKKCNKKDFRCDGYNCSL